MSSPKVWRRVVYIKWKDTAPPGAVAMAFNMHKSFPRLIPSVLSVSEGMTFTSLVNGGGAYPGVKAGEQNKGFHSAIEIILSCSTTAEMAKKYFDHPAHKAAAEVIDPLIEDAWAMDWLEDRDTLVVPSATVAVMKHLVFFQFEEGTTQAQRSALFAAWRALPGQLPHVLAVSCDEPIRWDRGEKRGFHAGLVVDLALSSCDGVQEISDYANSEAYQKINGALLAPIRKSYVVMDFAEHRAGMGAGATSKL
mmetsp:Transcript_126511/g.369653  ORF Transcript_126511/g.369653 Transcript_126511/m.369653 type:complete len:251 (-) Transcript_126511:53-805(-)